MFYHFFESWKPVTVVLTVVCCLMSPLLLSLCLQLWKEGTESSSPSKLSQLTCVRRLAWDYGVASRSASDVTAPFPSANVSVQLVAQRQPANL